MIPIRIATQAPLSTITANAGRVAGATFGADATSTGAGTLTVTGAGNYRGGAQAGIVREDDAGAAGADPLVGSLGELAARRMNPEISGQGRDQVSDAVSSQVVGAVVRAA